MEAAPLPLLGTFHELSIAVPDVRAAVEFYERLGFAQTSTSDTFSHPYGVLSDGRLYIGLHQRPGPSPVLSFVRPGIAASVAAFRAAGIEPSTLRVGEEVFNELAFSDPFGQAVALLEARTYSPLAREQAATSLCGDFAEYSAPVSDFAAAQRFWEPLGFVAAEEAQTPYAHLTLTSDHLDLAFHQPAFQRRPLLVFRDVRLGERLALLEARGMPLNALPAGGALLSAPDGTALLLLEESPE